MSSACSFPEHRKILHEKFSFVRLPMARARASCVPNSKGAPVTLRGQSTLLLAGLFAQSGQPGDAVELLTTTMADENSALAPEQALLEIGRIQREQGDIDAAHEAWQRVIDEFGETAAASEARQHLGPTS